MTKLTRPCEKCKLNLNQIGGVAWKLVRVTDKLTMARASCSRCGRDIVSYEPEWSKGGPTVEEEMRRAPHVEPEQPSPQVQKKKLDPWIMRNLTQQGG